MKKGRLFLPRIAIVMVDGVLAAPVFELTDALAMANRYADQQYAARETLPPSIDVRFVSPDGADVVDAGGRRIAVDARLAEIECDLAYLAPFAVGAPEEFGTRLAAHRDIISWLVAARDGGTALAASGSAVGLFASAGLIGEEVVPVAWWLEKAMHRLFPRLTLDAERRLTIGDDLLMAGVHGAEAALVIRIIEHTMSPDVAGWIERISGIDPYPDGVEPGLHLQPAILRHDEMVLRAAHWMQLRFARRPAIDDVAAAMGVHPRTLSRRFRSALGMTPVDYLQRLRVEAAKRMLARSNRKIDRVAYLVGYSDAAFFNAVFREHTGMTPAAYRRAAGGLVVRPTARPVPSDNGPAKDS